MISWRFNVNLKSQMLMYTADLVYASDKKMSDADIEKLVNDLIDRLGLRSCEHTKIGSPLKKGISGGQAKRVDIGVQLLEGNPPPLLALDEPTSGLDFGIAMEVVKLISELAASKLSTIISTIHQPSREMLQCFSHLCLLDKGQLAFLGRIEDVHPFFESIGRPIAENENPAEKVITTIDELRMVSNSDVHPKNANEAGTNHHVSNYSNKPLPDLFAESQLYAENLNRVRETRNAPNQNGAVENVQVSKHLSFTDDFTQQSPCFFHYGSSVCHTSMHMHSQSCVGTGATETKLLQVAVEADQASDTTNSERTWLHCTTCHNQDRLHTRPCIYLGQPRPGCHRCIQPYCAHLLSHCVSICQQRHNVAITAAGQGLLVHFHQVRR